MVNFKNLADKAKQTVEQRGGKESLKQDAEQLKSIAKGPGSITDKAKAAAAAIKDPGSAEKPPTTAGTSEAPTSATAPKAADGASQTPKAAAGKAKTEASESAGTTPAHDDSPGEVGGSK